MHSIRFVALTLILLATLVGIGIAHGLRTDRWASEVSNASELQALEKMPAQIGNEGELGSWQGKTIHRDNLREALPDESTTMVRRYVSRENESVAVLLTRGRSGPMVIKHLPTECYPSSGYDIVGSPKRYLTKHQPADEFWVATFKKSNQAFPLVVRVYWSWSADGRWQTPDQPRLTFARHATLYKLYVVQDIPNENVTFEGSPVHDFIDKFTDAMRSSFFVSPKS